MILAVETYAARRQLGEEAGFRTIKDAGFDGVDFSFYRGPDMLGEDYLENARRSKENLERSGLVCHQAHAPYEFCYCEAMDPSNPHYLKVLRAMEYASILGAEQIIVHGIKVPEGPYSEQCHQYNLQYYNSLAPYCRKFGIRIGVENLITTIYPRPELLSRMVTSLDSTCFIACMDLGHALVAGMQTEEYLAALAPGILHALHIHDNDGTSDQHRLPYLGDVHWDAVMEALAAYGYTGDFTMELTGYLSHFSPALLSQALQLAGAVGRDLMKKFLAIRAK